MYIPLSQQLLKLYLRCKECVQSYHRDIVLNFKELSEHVETSAEFHIYTSLGLPGVGEVQESLTDVGPDYTAMTSVVGQEDPLFIQIHANKYKSPCIHSQYVPDTFRDEVHVP